MATKRYTYCVTNITQGGESCKNPTYQWDIPSCMALVNEDNNCITVEVDLEASPSCSSFDVTIDCEDCQACPPQTKTITLCTDNQDCPGCHSCINGICVDQCPGQLCDGNECVACLVNGDCTGGKVCAGGECVCPSGEFEDAYGNCVECLNDGNCQDCEVCVGGNCDPKCPGNLCDNDVCVECLIDGDCTEANQCCQPDGTCDCCAGYRWDPATDTCVPVTECKTNGDCGDCEYCNAGNCEPIVCPAGFVNSGIAGQCCAEECNCSAPDCPQDHICLNYYTNSCFCKECTGTCDQDGDCGEGCLCVDGQCEVNTCYGTCSNGGDCGPGCGCRDGECVPCDINECSTQECADTNGCECVNGNCKESDCKGGCVNGECGPGCGCDEGDCVTCETKSCVNNEDCPFGCYCDTGLCRPNPCQNTYCSSPDDCGNGCGCEDGRCVPCTSISCAECDTVLGCVCESGTCQEDEDYNCDAKAYITKGDCEVTFAVEQDENCACPEISARFTAENVVSTTVGGQPAYTFDIRVEVLKDGVHVNSTNIDNELPLQEVYIGVTYRIFSVEIDTLGNPIAGSTWYDYDSQATPLSVRNTGEWVVSMPTDVTLYKPGAEFSRSNGKTYRVHKVSLETGFILDNKVKLANFCYGKSSDDILFSQVIGGPDITNGVLDVVPFETISSTFTNKIVANIYKSSSTNFGTLPSLKYYLTDYDPITKRRSVTLPGSSDIESNRFYKLESDCGCAEIVYSCLGEGEAPSALIFCDPKEADYLNKYTIDPCAETLTFDEDIIIDCAGITDATDKQKYRLRLNGVAVDTRVVGGGGVLYASGTSFTTKSGQITSWSVEIVEDGCQDCKVEFTHTPENGPCTVGCTSDTTNVLAVAVDDTTAPCTTGVEFTVTDGWVDEGYTLYIYEGSVPQLVIESANPPAPYETHTGLQDGVAYDVPGLFDGTYTYYVTDGLGCARRGTFSVTGCSDMSLDDITVSCTVNDGEVDVTPTATGSSNYNLYMVNQNGGFLQQIFTAETAANISLGTTVSNVPNGIYQFILEQPGTPSYTKEISDVIISCCTGTYTATWDPTIPGVVFEKNGSPYVGQVTISLNGSVIFNDIAPNANSSITWVAGSTYSVKFVDGACSTTVNVTISPCSVIATTPTLVCDVTSYTFTFSSISGSNSGAFSFTATDGTISTSAPITMTDLGGGSFEVVLTIGADIPSEFVNDVITYTITDSVDSSCVKTATISRPTDCAGDIVVSYNCTNGIVITQGGSPYVGSIIIDGGAPTAYSSGIYLTDGNHTVKIGGTVFPVNGINCCSTLSVIGNSTTCDISGITLNWSVSGGSSSYNITFKDEFGNTLAPSVSGATPGTYNTTITGITNGATLIIEATDANYSYVYGIGAPSSCVETDSVVVDVCAEEPSVAFVGCDPGLDALRIFADIPECGATSISSVRYGTPDIPTVNPEAGDVSTWYNATSSGIYYLADLTVFTPCSCGSSGYDNSWSVPNGMLVEVTYTQGTCGTTTKYVFFPANAGPAGCESCTGFNCEV